MTSFIRRSIVVVLLCLVVLPVSYLCSSFFYPIQFELSSGYMGEVIITTILFISGVTLFSTLLGTGLGYITSIYRFPGSQYLSWGLFLPFCAPSYVLAFVHVALWEKVVNTNSLIFAILIMSLSLYPYVYLFARTAFLSQGKQALEVS